MMKRHESAPAGGANRGGLWKNERGQFRLVWLWLAGFAIYALLNRGAEAVVALAMHRLNAYLNALATVVELQTPLWASAILDHYDPILSMVEGLMTIAVFLWLSRRFRLGGGHHHAFRLTQALRWMHAVRERLRRMAAKNTSLEEKMADIRLVNRAKWLLITELSMTEPDAHRYIEKQAMDRCVPRRVIAQQIIQMYE